MIHFPPLRTRRLTVQLRELPIAESIAVASIPSHLDEASCTAFLRGAIESVSGISDPAQWTVQERTLAVCHYLACTLEDGPDFPVGDGKFSDYLDGAADEQAAEASVEVGELDGDVWTLRHLTGAMAESIERLAGEIEGVGERLRLHWLVGAMACQLVRAGESVPDASDGEGAFDDFLRHRMSVLMAFPESAFAALMGMFLQGRGRLHHLFRVEFADDGGLIAMPKGGAAAGLPPARFPVHTCLSQLARDLCR